MSNASSPSAGPSSESEDRRSARPPEIPLAALTAFAHEMRNALGPVRTATYLLRASTGSDAQALWALDLIDRQAMAMATAIDALTDLVRLARGTLQFAWEAVDLGEALEAAAAACAMELAEKRQSLVWNRPAVPVALSTDRVRLIQSFAALMQAASNAAPAASRIVVALGAREREANIAIGSALDATNAAPSAADGDPGSGLSAGDGDAGSAYSAGKLAANVSLALAQRLIERLGGATSATGPARFEVRLPLAD
jgi:nitrogen-specific signal transduction histidine kinase